MKIIILLLLSASCFGQNTMQGFWNGDTTNRIFVGNMWHSLTVFDSVKPVYDTIPVTILYCDTSRVTLKGWPYFIEDSIATKKYYDTAKNPTGWMVIGKWIEDTSYLEPNKSVYWMKGYEVMEVINSPSCSKCLPSIIHLIYLDDKRKPLGKNIVVWLSKSF
jgi:hypothetical protein